MKTSECVEILRMLTNLLSHTSSYFRKTIRSAYYACVMV